MTDMQKIPYRLIRSSRKTVSIQLTPAGEVVVRAPRSMALRTIDGFVESRRSWIAKHLSGLAPP